jgi:hypothetical protein
MAAKKAAAKKRTRPTTKAGRDDLKHARAVFDRSGPADYEIVAETPAGREQRRADERAKFAAVQKEQEAARLAIIAEQFTDGTAFQRTTDSRAKSCPFCGSEPVVRFAHSSTVPTASIVVCDNHALCRVRPHAHGSTLLEALKFWNHRQDGAIGTAAAGEGYTFAGIAAHTAKL